MTERPNILVFLCDELQRDLLRCYGGSAVRTPALDSLARDSIVFDNAYTPTALCSPARASIMTGVYPHVHQVLVNTGEPRYSHCQRLRPEMTMLQDWVQQQGHYESAYFGKWHIGNDECLQSARFDNKQAFPHPLSTYHPGPWLGTVLEPVAEQQGGLLDIPLHDFPDVQTADLAVDFLRRRKGEQPFLLFCAPPGPHPRWLIPEEFGNRYDPSEVVLPKNLHDPFVNKPLYQRRLAERDVLRRLAAGEGEREELLRRVLSYAYSYIELVDQALGQVLAALRQSGHYDDTLILFTADHGSMSGAHGMMNKGAYMYDETYRVPLVIKRPHDDAGRQEQAFVQHMDLTATLLHAMSGTSGLSLGRQAVQGASLLPLLDGNERWERTLHYAQYHGDDYGFYSARMVTDGHWKLVLNLSDLGELYHLDDDPHELHNVFYDPTCRDQRALMLEQLYAQAEYWNDTVFVLWDKKHWDTKPG